MLRRAIPVLAIAVVVSALVAAGCKPPDTGVTGPTPGATGPVAKGKAPTPGVPAVPAELKYPDKYECIFDADCKWLEGEAQKEMNSALSRFAEIDVVYAHNDPSAHGAFMAAQQEGKGREKTIKFIGIDANPDEGLRYIREGVLSVTFDYQTGAAEGIKAAVRILAAEKLPQNITLGTKIITPDNIEQGGEYVPPDAREGWETVDVLDKGPLPKLPKAKYVIGYSQCNLGEPWRIRMNAELQKAAEAHPALELMMKDAQNKTETQQSQVREFITQKVDLIIISPKEAGPLTAPVKEAMDAEIPVIVLDRKVEGEDYTCFIGGDNVMIGRLAGNWVREQFPDGAKIVELKGLMTSTPAGERHQGFLEGLNAIGPGGAAPAPTAGGPTESKTETGPTPAETKKTG